jgi:dihydroorotase
MVVTEGGVVRADVAVSGEKIVGIVASGETSQAKRAVDIGGLHLLPGLIDMHSHHREPGFTHKEDVITATKCCAAGGVTVSVGMPNVSPPPTTAEILTDIFALYKEKAIVDYNMNPAATVLEEIPRLATMGILAFKIFMVVDTGRSYPHMPGIGVHDHGKLLSIFQAVQKTGLPLMVHPHDQALMTQIEQTYWAEGRRDFRAYAQAYAAHDGMRLHLLHLQTKRCVEMLRAAKAEGRPVSAEVNPWALWLGNDWDNIERLGSYALSYYVAPHHYEAVWKGLLEGIVDIIATDHAPHLKEEKEPGWTDGWKAHTGTPSEQHYLSLLLTDVSAGRISLERAVEIVSTKPAKLFGLYPRKGAIRVGADADMVAVDLNKEHVISDEEVLSKCGWTPYARRKVRGLPVHTLVRGQFVFENEKVVGEPGHGRLASPV